MGSDSDLATMAAAAQVRKHTNVAFSQLSITDTQATAIAAATMTSYTFAAWPVVSLGIMASAAVVAKWSPMSASVPRIHLMAPTFTPVGTSMAAEGSCATLHRC